ncbi:phage protein NinX family protein [Enterobacter hormaechei]
MDYSQLSDFEINKRVADIVMNGTWHVRPSHPDNTTGGWLYGSSGIQTHDLPDYCNNASDAWPIISANRIAIIPAMNADKWAANHGDWDVFSTDAKPLRAAMIVFLMMQDAKHA